MAKKGQVWDMKRPERLPHVAGRRPLPKWLSDMPEGAYIRRDWLMESGHYKSKNVVAASLSKFTERGILVRIDRGIYQKAKAKAGKR